MSTESQRCQWHLVVLRILSGHGSAVSTARDFFLNIQNCTDNDTGRFFFWKTRFSDLAVPKTLLHHNLAMYLTYLTSTKAYNSNSNTHLQRYAYPHPIPPQVHFLCNRLQLYLQQGGNIPPSWLYSTTAGTAFLPPSRVPLIHNSNYVGSMVG